MPKQDDNQVLEESDKATDIVTEKIDTEEEMPIIVEFNDDDEGEFIDDEKLFSKKNFIILGISLLTTLILFGITLVILLYPFSYKVSGQWQAKLAADTMELEVNDGHAILNAGHLSLDKAMTISFEGKLRGSSMNAYELTKLKSFVTIEKKELPEKELSLIKNNKEIYMVDSETTDQLRLQYTPEGQAYLLGEENGERYFSFVREGVWFGESPLLYLNNSLLAEGRILFQKDSIKDE